MARRSSDLILVVVVAGAAVLVTLLAVNDTLLRAAFALPLVLVLSGYATTTAVFPRGTLGTPERLLFSLGSSLAVAALGGIVLNWTPWGLQPVPWVVLLSSTALGASAIALLRRQRDLRLASAPVTAGLDIGQGLLFGLAALVVIGAIGVARAPATQHGLQGYSLLWRQRESSSRPGLLRLGVSCMEFTATEYSLQVEVGGHTALEWPSITLEPGQTWEGEAVLSTAELESGLARVLLYRLDDPTRVYRFITWQPGNPGG